MVVVKVQCDDTSRKLVVRTPVSNTKKTNNIVVAHPLH